jgi:transposase InsO family protein
VNVAQVCSHFGISRQAHYQKVQREIEQCKEDAIVLEMVREVRRKHPRMGGRKLLFKIRPMMAAEGLQIGRDGLFDLLRQQDLLVVRKKTYRRTTIPGLWRAPNRLPGLVIVEPNQVWVCDITYLELELSRFAYLFVLMDLFSRYIVGWHVATSLAADGALISLERALTGLPSPTHHLIHHSDHGVQYTSHAYMDTLLQHHILASMGAVGSCYDNIFAERVIGILKGEYCLDAPFVEYTQVMPAVEEVIHLYNTDRPHLSLNLATPRDVYFGLYRNIPPVVIPVAA